MKKSFGRYARLRIIWEFFEGLGLAPPSPAVFGPYICGLVSLAGLVLVLAFLRNSRQEREHAAKAATLLNDARYREAFARSKSAYGRFLTEYEYDYQAWLCEDRIRSTNQEAKSAVRTNATNSGFLVGSQYLQEHGLNKDEAEENLEVIWADYTKGSGRESARSRSVQVPWLGYSQRPNPGEAGNIILSSRPPGFSVDGREGESGEVATLPTEICTGCGTKQSFSEMFFSGNGLVCSGCYGQG